MYQPAALVGHRIPVFYDLEKLPAAIREDAARKGEPSPRSIGRGKASDELLSIALNTLDDDCVRAFSVASTDDLTAGRTIRPRRRRSRHMVHARVRGRSQP